MILPAAASLESPSGVVFQCELGGGTNRSPSCSKGKESVSLCPVEQRLSAVINFPPRLITPSKSVSSADLIGLTGLPANSTQVYCPDGTPLDSFQMYNC